MKIPVGLVGVIALAAVSLAAPQPAIATDSSTGSASSFAVVKVSDPSPDASTLAYWTPARMHAALSEDDGAPGAPASAPPMSPTIDVQAAAQPDTTAPYDARSIGKLFVHRTVGGDISCTAVTIIGGHSKNLAATAAHCLDDPSGPIASAVYVPGYNSGVPATGSFPLRGYVLPTGYVPSSGAQHDAAFMFFGRNCCGKNLGDIGRQNGISFYRNPSGRVTQAGYGNNAGDTQHLSQCVGVQAYADPDDTTRIATSCVFGPGASGGPYLIVTGTPQQYDTVIGVMRGSAGNGAREVGPLFGDAERTAYNRAVDNS